MSTFEFTFLVNDKKSVTNLEEVLKSYNGKKINEESLGKRLLAYPIDKNESAEYIVWQIELEKNVVKDFKQKLNFDKVVMRYLMLLKEDKKKK
ncbi:30S ribosomal protein S6 [Candidatus Roizmanbacteria bacterium CG_4_10_14_0_2_um_filter_39_13]|uniref:Small ribosomal subunit protein bS6 n=1 Tax=Candidatus Roizmanbacteria bacterium CG_4_10_14_0_2_um_filter_39_13 TaxID=1974825 RepID=A0A2M7U0Y8_9BACT|nr:MAG: 30S ribosomal protein S6 [Candidatus Roizmanbacteria bacterium CG_4_10_14_0_2_um_filter_39_13]